MPPANVPFHAAYRQDRPIENYMHIALLSKQFSKKMRGGKAHSAKTRILQISMWFTVARDSMGTNLHIDFTPLPLPPLAEDWQKICPISINISYGKRWKSKANHWRRG